jgi:hypothetical protein
MAGMKMAEAIDAGFEFGSASWNILRGEIENGELIRTWISAAQYLSKSAFESAMETHGLSERSPNVDRGRIDRSVRGEVKDIDKDEMEVELRPITEREKRLAEELERQENSMHETEKPDRPERETTEPVQVPEKPNHNQ